jgi:uncharacterized membrane-anchored protein
MIQSKKNLAFAFLFPIFVLAMLTFYKAYILSTGEEIILPISGYDPRDLLSGHYLTYSIDYGLESVCKPNTNSNQQPGYVCLEPKMFSYTAPEGCSKMIRGVCSDYGRFTAGIEKYYIPEDKAKMLDNQIRQKAASIVLSITPGGQAQVKDLLINGKSWRNLK